MLNKLIAIAISLTSAVALVLGGTVATSATAATNIDLRGEAGNHGPLRFPTPAEMSMGSSWSVRFAVGPKGLGVSTSCRVATKCTALVWKKGMNTVATTAYRTKRAWVKAEAQAIKQWASKLGRKVTTQRQGKIVTYLVQGRSKTGSHSFAYSVYNNTRIGLIEVNLTARASAKLKKATAAKKLAVWSAYMANPRNGRVLYVSPQVSPN